MDVLASGGQIEHMRIDEKNPVNGVLLSLLSKRYISASGQTPSILGLAELEESFGPVVRFNTYVWHQKDFSELNKGGVVNLYYIVV